MNQKNYSYIYILIIVLLLILSLYNSIIIGLSWDETFHNINGKLTLIINNLKNSIITDGNINLSIKESIITLESSTFEIKGIGIIKSDFRYYQDKGDLIFTSENVFEINNKKEFSRKFQLASKNIKNVDKIYFDFEKNINNGEISISNVYLNQNDKKNSSEEFYIIKNLQELKSLIRNFLS